MNKGWRQKQITEKETHDGSLKSIIGNLASWDIGHKSTISRLIFVTIILGLCYLCIGYKLLVVATAAYEEQKHFVREENFRKEIVDRNGLLLAINLPGASVFANPQKMVDPEEAANKLAATLPKLNKQKLLEEFKSNKTFVWIKRDLTEKERQSVHHLGIPGIYFEGEKKRVYTYGNLLSHLIGYVGRDNEGLAGLEKSYDDFLLDSSSNGPLQLTIDARVQSIVNEEMDTAIETFRAIGGVAIVADAKTGEILACVSKPDFNPHDPSNASSDQLFNRYSLGVQELGSVMKIVNIAIGLDTEKITLNDVYDITSMRVANFNLKDYHKAEGWHTVPEIFLHSSNIGMAQIMLEVGKSDYKRYLERLGMFEKLPIEIPERGFPISQKDSNWTDLTTTTMSYGYALAVSPLHFVNAVIPVVNGGYMHNLHFVKREDEAVPVQVLKSTTSDDMRRLLRLGVSKGTGRKADVKGYLVSGKTGTAERRVGRRYVKNARNSSFLAAVPAIDPKYVIFIMLEAPKPTKETFGFATAGWTTAPMARNIISRMVNLYGLSPYDEDDPAIQEQLYVEYEIDAET